MPPANPRILVADDEPKYVQSLALILQAKGYEVLTAPDGKAAVELAGREAPALILLDVRIPKLDGCETCRQIRTYSLAPIVMVTALGQDTDIIAGLEAGADDYVVKPFGIERLLARLKMILGWIAAGREQSPEEGICRLGDLSVNFAQQAVFVGERPVLLSPAEYQVLSELAHVKHSLTTDVLLKRIWGPAHEDVRQFVSTFIRRLRQKIEVDPEAPQFILTQPDGGYNLGKRIPAERNFYPVSG